jgi:HEPN domain-containing protein
MADPMIVKEWLNKADDDFRFAETNLKSGSLFYAQICFHFQQSAEKSLKAYIISKNLPFDKVHDLIYILRTCSAFDPNLRPSRRTAYFLPCLHRNALPCTLADELH